MSSRMERLWECVAHGELCTVLLTGDRSFTAFVLAAGRDCLVLEAYDDFVSDGLWVVRTGDVELLEVSDSNRFFESVIRREGRMRRLPPKSAYRSFRSLVVWAADAGRIVRVDEIDEPDACWLGRVFSVSAEDFSLVEVNADGTWREEPYERDFDEVRALCVGGLYNEMFEQYAAEAPALKRSAK